MFETWFKIWPRSVAPSDTEDEGSRHGAGTWGGTGFVSMLPATLSMNEVNGAESQSLSRIEVAFVKTRGYVNWGGGIVSLQRARVSCLWEQPGPLTTLAEGPRGDTGTLVRKEPLIFWEKSGALTASCLSHSPSVLP